jgi:chromosome segregation and condensation protein ScpB
MNPEAAEKQARSMSEIVAIVEALVFVSDEPLAVKTIAEVLDEDRDTIQAALEELN